MRCDYHPDVDAVGSCVSCEKLVCAECRVILDGETYCNLCADRLFVRIDRLPKVQTVSWFEKHLNWTIILTIVAANIIFFIVGSFVLAFTNMEISDQGLQMLAYIIGLAVLLPVCGWVLKKKNRSPYYLFLLLVPLGLVWLLLLENRSSEPTARRGGYF